MKIKYKIATFRKSEAELLRQVMEKISNGAEFHQKIIV